MYDIALEMRLINIYIYFSNFCIIKNVCCGYSLEAPRRGASNENPQNILEIRKKKSQYFGSKIGLPRATSKKCMYAFYKDDTID